MSLPFWKLEWILPAASPAAAIACHSRSRSLFISGCFSPRQGMRTLRVDAKDGAVRASVSVPGHGTRAFGFALPWNSTALIAANHSSIAVHDSETLETTVHCTRRVPKNITAICAIRSDSPHELWVAIATPAALLEFELNSSRLRRIVSKRPAGMGLVGGQLLCIMENGDVLRREDAWSTVGRFPEGASAVAFDELSASVAVLSDSIVWAKDGHDALGPGRPTKRLWTWTKGDDFTPQCVTLSTKPKFLGFVQGHVACVDVDRTATVLARCDSASSTPVTLPGTLNGFSASGFLTLYGGGIALTSLPDSF